MTQRAPLFLVSGPSGVGKTTLVDELLRKTQLPLRRAITATTRKQRPNEIPEVHYHFWDANRFERELKTDGMLEHAIVHNRDYYGTPRSEVDPYRERGTGVILVIDVQGAAAVRLLYPGDHYSLFVAPPTFATLELRLRSRGEAEESIQRRLETARQELARASEFDRVLINDDLATAVAWLDAIVRERFSQ